MTKLFLIVALLILFATPASAADSTVWQLNPKDSHPTNCKLAFVQMAKDGQGQPCLTAGALSHTPGWHSCISVPAGYLKAGEDYIISLDYTILNRPDDQSYFYVFGRSSHLGYGADRWQRWHGEAGYRGTAKLKISPTADDYGIVVGIHDQGAMQIRSMKIIHGDGETIIPLESNSGIAAPPAPPTGAQPFTVDAPNNKDGPTLNLANFGLVADGSSPPEAGPDRNLAALEAALTKCRATGASKLTVPNGVYRITSGKTMVFKGLKDFTFDGGGSTFLFDKIPGGAGIALESCNRTVFCNFNLDWDWNVEPLASIGRITRVAPDSSFFEMRFEKSAPLDPKRWITMNPLDEKLRAPGAGGEIGGFNPKKIESLDARTVRVFPSYHAPVILGRLYLLRHYTFDKHGIVLSSNTHMSLKDVTIFSFPGIGFIGGGDQHHLELQHCRITYPENDRRPITVTADGFHVDNSQGFIKLENCDFGYMGDDCVNIHDNFHAGVRSVDSHTLVLTKIVPWRCPFQKGDLVEIRNGDFSPTGFKSKLTDAKADYKNSELMLVFDRDLPERIASDSIFFNHRYDSHNCIIRNCYFHENRARGVLCNTADWLIEDNRFFHNQHAGLFVITDTNTSWSEGFGAKNIIVRNNKFESLNSCGGSDGVAVYIFTEINGSPSSYPILTNILLENNVISETTGPAIGATSFKNLVIRGNTIVNRKKAPTILKMRGSIRAELGSGLWVEENTWSTGKDIAEPSLLYDAETTRNVVCKNNHL